MHIVSGISSFWIYYQEQYSKEQRALVCLLYVSKLVRNEILQKEVWRMSLLIIKNNTAISFYSTPLTVNSMMIADDDRHIIRTCTACNKLSKVQSQLRKHFQLISLRKLTIGFLAWTLLFLLLENLTATARCFSSGQASSSEEVLTVWPPQLTH